MFRVALNCILALAHETYEIFSVDRKWPDL